MTALEVLSEPFTLLVLLASLALAVFAPTFHYHQFGEVTRMARDAGVSALMTGGTIAALFAAVKSVRRELESGTAAVVLSHGVSRGGFLLAKILGVFAAYFLFAVSVACVALTMVLAAWIGGSRAGGDVARVWGPATGCALFPVLLPLLGAAALSRFARARFTLSANMLTLAISFLGMLLAFGLAARNGMWFYHCRYLLVEIVALAQVMVPVLLWIVVAACAARCRTGVASALTVLVMALTLPFGCGAICALPLALYLGVLAFEKLELS